MADLYEHAGIADAESSDTSTEDDLPLQDFSSRYSPSFSGFHGNKQLSGDVHARLVRTPSSDEEDEKGGGGKTMDPGPFRYNKRLFVTALPCLLLTLAMTGEILVLVVSVGGLVIMLMTHLGPEANRKCVVVFALLFIPCQVLVVGTVLPLLWLSVWNVVVVALVNMFCILTGGWLILQFAAFRREEPALCAVVEQLLFAVYPFVCCALVTWVLSTVVSPAFSPFIFLCLWFVYLQLYLMPAVSSFKTADDSDEDLSVIQPPIAIAIVLVFIASGPAVHALLTVAGSSLSAVFSVASLVMVCELLCLGLFLSTLLSLRQLCEYMGVAHSVVVGVRWASGGGLVLLSSPTLHHLGMVSHFLLSLPLAVAAFAALGFTVSLRKGKVLSLLLIVVVMMLMCLWLNHLPWTLTYRVLGALPLRVFNVVVGVNFVVCVLSIYAAGHWSTELLGSLLLLQSAVTTVCESGLHHAGLYPLPTFQLTGVLASYMLYRLYTANKIARNTATLACALQLAKMTLGAVGYIRKVGKGEETGVVNVTVVDFLTLLGLMAVLVWLFVYEAKEEATLPEVVKDIVLLMVSLATSSQSLLVPLGQVMLQTDLSPADLLGLWGGVGGALVLLYALHHHHQGSGVRGQLMKVAGIMGMTGALVVITQPVFELSLLSLYQGSELVSLVVMGVMLLWGVGLRPTHRVGAAGLLGLGPGLHVAWLLYGEEATLLHFLLVAPTTSILLAFLLVLAHTHTASHTTHRFFTIGTVSLVAMVVAVLAVDAVSLQCDRGVWSYPGWRLAFLVTVAISLCLKALAEKLGPGHLPLTQAAESTAVLPVLANAVTVSTVLLARTQGPQDPLLHDLWSCVSSVLLTLLQHDPLLFPSLSPGNRATPIIMTALASLVLSTLSQSRLWGWQGPGSVALGVAEVASVVCSLPVYLVLLGVLWRGEVWGEKAVVFTLPLNAFVFLLASSYTGWALSVAGVVCGVGLMACTLPLLPCQSDALT